jgi:hypothetical protein
MVREIFQALETGDEASVRAATQRYLKTRPGVWATSCWVERSHQNTVRFKRYA